MGALQIPGDSWKDRQALHPCGRLSLLTTNVSPNRNAVPVYNLPVFSFKASHKLDISTFDS